jgi:hypothetical protein
VSVADRKGKVVKLRNVQLTAGVGEKARGCSVEGGNKTMW